MAHWKRVLPDRIHEVRYGDLVHEQERHMGELLALCDLPWDLHYLDLAGNRAPVATASAVQVRQPLYRSAIGRRRRHGARLGPLRRLLDA